MTPDSAERKQDGKGPGSLFGLGGGLLGICALWLLAPVLTEALNRALILLDGLAYAFVFLVLVFLLLLGAALGSALFRRRGDVGSAIRGPRVMEQGYARLRQWTERSARRSILYRGGLGAAIGIIGIEAARFSATPSQSGSWDFFSWLIMIVSGFGFASIWLLLSSLVAGLWPARPSRS